MGVGYARLHPTISIHALREESDHGTKTGRLVGSLFQSTLSVRRATHATFSVVPFFVISIHALREESDPYYALTGKPWW